MNASAIEVLKKIEQTVGTHKFMQCICLGGIGFLLGMILFRR